MRIAPSTIPINLVPFAAFRELLILLEDTVHRGNFLFSIAIEVVFVLLRFSVCCQISGIRLEHVRLLEGCVINGAQCPRQGKIFRIGLQLHFSSTAQPGILMIVLTGNESVCAKYLNRWLVNSVQLVRLLGLVKCSLST